MAPHIAVRGRECKTCVLAGEPEPALAALPLVEILGISTSVGVDTTARAAYERSYNVTFASDAMTDRDPVLHECAVTKIFPRLGEVATTDAILVHVGG